MTSIISHEAARRLRPAGAFHLPPGGQPVGSVVEFVVEDSQQQPEILFIDTRRELSWRIMMSAQGPGRWVAEAMMPMDATVVTYTFSFPDGTGLMERRQFEGRNKPDFGQWIEQPFKVAVYEPAGMPPEWSQGMVIYQIFPDRFANGDTSTDRAAYGVYGHAPLFKDWGDTPEHPPLGRDFYGGDLRGVIQKLDYLKDLGVECIYFTPLFASPSNHRYDANDYLQIDPMLGTEADFDEMLQEAHQRGIHIVLDAVYNHCSVDSRYFGMAKRYEEQGAIDSKESPYYRWFEFNHWPHDWVGWIGLKHMPEFAECPEVEEFFTGSHGPTAFWTRKGVDGWRTDVTGCNSDVFWRRWRRRLNLLNPVNYTVAEEWEDASHYLLGDMFSATMNYRFSWALHGLIAYDKLTPSEADDRLQTWLRDTPGPAQKAQMNLLDSHDTWRALTACGGDRARFKQMLAFQFAYTGAPMIYYGNEFGLEGDYAESGRKTIDWTQPDADLHGFYKQLISVRKSLSPLRLGSLETVLLDDDARTYVFCRNHNGRSVYAAFNASDSPADVRISLDAGMSALWHDAIGGHGSVEAVSGTLTLTLAPRGFAWLAE